MPNDSPRKARRDTHGRGMRGPLLPHIAPSHESRDQFFARQLRNAIKDLDGRMGKKVAGITFGFEEIPNLRDLILSEGAVSLGRIDQGNPVKIVLYQRPIEARSLNNDLMTRITRDVLAELVSSLLGLHPQDVDPDYQGPQIRN